MFVASKSGIVNVFDSLGDTTPTQFADLRSKVHDFWDRGLLGLALDPGFTTGRPYVYVLYAYDKAPDSRSRAGVTAARAAGRDRRRLRRQRPALAARHLRRRDGPDRRLLPAVPEPLGRHARLRARRHALRQRGRRRVVQLRRLRPGRQPVRRPAGRDGRPPRPGRRAALAAFRRPAARPCRSTARSCASTPTPARRRPATRRSGTPNPAAAGSSPTASATRSASRSARARARSGRVTSAGTRGRRSTGCPDVAGPQLRLALLRGRRRGWAAYDSLNLDTCETLYAQGTATRAVLHLQPRAKVVAGRELHDRARRRSPASRFYTGDAFPAAYKDALFFSDYSRNCIWVMYQGANGLPDPAHAADVPGRRGRPGVPHPGPGRRALLRRSRRRHDPPDRGQQHARRRRGSRRTPTSGAAPLTVAFDGRDSSDPKARRSRTRGTSTAMAPTTTRPPAAPSFTYTSAGTVTVRLRVTDPVGLTGTAVHDDHRRRRARGDDRHALERDDVGGRRHDRFAGSARTSAGAALPASGAVAGGSACATARASTPTSCHTHAHPGLRRRRVGQLRRAGPRIPVAPRALR